MMCVLGVRDFILHNGLWPFDRF